MGLQRDLGHLRNQAADGEAIGTDCEFLNDGTTVGVRMSLKDAPMDSCLIRDTFVVCYVLRAETCLRVEEAT